MAMSFVSRLERDLGLVAEVDADDGDLTLTLPQVLWRGGQQESAAPPPSPDAAGEPVAEHAGTGPITGVLPRLSGEQSESATPVPERVMPGDLGPAALAEPGPHRIDGPAVEPLCDDCGERNEDDSPAGPKTGNASGSGTSAVPVAGPSGDPVGWPEPGSRDGVPWEAWEDELVATGLAAPLRRCGRGGRWSSCSVGSTSSSWPRCLPPSRLPSMGRAIRCKLSLVPATAGWPSRNIRSPRDDRVRRGWAMASGRGSVKRRGYFRADESRAECRGGRP